MLLPSNPPPACIPNVRRGILSLVTVTVLYVERTEMVSSDGCMPLMTALYRLSSYTLRSMGRVTMILSFFTTVSVSASVSVSVRITVRSVGIGRTAVTVSWRTTVTVSVRKPPLP